MKCMLLCQMCAWHTGLHCIGACPSSMQDTADRHVLTSELTDPLKLLSCCTLHKAHVLV